LSALISIFFFMAYLCVVLCHLFEKGDDLN
jgi:hypothetical protein